MDQYLFNTYKLTKANFYISEETRQSILDLNRFIIKNEIDFCNIEDGKKHYDKLGELVDCILLATRKEVLNSHNINKLLKEKSSNKKMDINI